jgi:rsbT co-antagonist protein RsbR
MGADCVISGIRPQIAQTIVALGIEFNDIVTKSSLADALTHTLRSAAEVLRIGDDQDVVRGAGLVTLARRRRAGLHRRA